jgi:hypothetical protein
MFGPFFKKKNSHTEFFEIRSEEAQKVRPRRFSEKGIHEDNEFLLVSQWQSSVTRLVL